MKKHVRLITLLLVLLLVLSALSGCAQKPAEPAKPADPGTPAETGTPAESGDTPAPEPSDDPLAGPAIDKDTVVICTADETPSLTTAGHNAVAGDYVNKLTHNGLFRLDKELNPTPDLVAEYTVEKDEKGEDSIWVMTLHEGVKFHDGSVMTTDDVLASIEHAQNSPDIRSYTQSIVKTEKVDDLTFKIYTDGPSASLLYDLSHHGNYIVPARQLAQETDPAKLDQLLNTEVIGAGPYKFVEWRKGEQITFTAHEDYFDAERAPKIKNIVWKIIPEGSSRTIALRAGDVDYIIETDSISIPELEADPNVAVMKVESVSHNWLTINNEVPPFDDINVRKAMNAAINKEDVVTVALNGTGVVAMSQTPTGMLGEYTGEYDAYDLDLAKKYMETWGGDPSTIKLEMICSNDTKARAAEVIMANLKEIGIESSIVRMDLATYLSVTAEGDFTGFIGGYTSNEMMSFLKGVYLSSNINSSNKTRTSEPELDELIIKATKTVDQGEREKVLQAATKFLNELCPQIPLYQDYTLSAHKANLKNTFITPGGSFFAQEWEW